MKLSSCALLPLAFLLLACTPHPHMKSTADSAGEQQQNAIAEARQLRQAGKAEQAVALLQKALKAEPDDPDLLGQLGYAQIAGSQPKDAVRTFDKLLSINPDSAAAYDGKAMAFDHSGNHLAAQELYQQALTLAPGSVRIKNNLAVSLILNGQLDQAISLLESLNASGGDNATVRQNLALAYGLSGQDDKALSLNLQDLPAEQARENLRFYKAYRQRQSLKAAEKEAPKQIGFAAAPTADKTAKKKNEPKRSAPVKETSPVYMEPLPSKADAPTPAPDSAMPLEPPPETNASSPAADIPSLVDPILPVSPADTSEKSVSSPQN